MKINNINNHYAEQSNSICKNHSFQAIFKIKPYKPEKLPSGIDILPFVWRKVNRIHDPNLYKTLEIYVSGMLAPIKPYDSKVVLNIYDNVGTAEILCYPPNDEKNVYSAKVGNVHSKNITAKIYKEAKPLLDFIYEKFC